MHALNAVDTRASSLIKNTLAWDNHACMPLRPGDTNFMQELSRHAAAGFDVVVLNVGFGEMSYDRHLAMITTYRDWLAQHDDQFSIVKAPHEIDDARAAGRLAVCFDVEGMSVLEDASLERIAILRDLGVLWMMVAYNRGNSIGAGCYDTNDAGLTRFGRAVLTEMKRVGMIACCSHTGEATARAVIEAADNPVIFSHSNSNAVWAHPRNISDDLIKAAASTGGVIGVNGIGPFLGAPDGAVAAFVRHVDYIAQLVGPEHVGIGLDYVFDHSELAEFIQTMPETFPGYDKMIGDFTMIPPEHLPAIVGGLLQRGYDDDALRGILGGNWRRVADTVWRRAEGRAQ